METQTTDIEDFTCTICLEIFCNPVTLSCSHTYCHRCSIGLKKHSKTDSEIHTFSLEQQSSGFAHLSHVHHADQSYVCAICRHESFGYIRNHQLEIRLATLATPCSHCSEILNLSALRAHLETCLPMKTSNNENKQHHFKSHLSQSQAEALQKAQQGENRSTFPCPFCERTNFSVTHLRQHIKKRHRGENQNRVCPICASMPWGDTTMITSNVYQHIKSRHRFDYDTYVNYELSEEAMMREALKASLADK